MPLRFRRSYLNSLALVDIPNLDPGELGDAQPRGRQGRIISGSDRARGATERGAAQDVSNFIGRRQGSDAQARGDG